MTLLAKTASRILVIDASIAAAAGDVSMDPISSQCRDFLNSVLDICHRIAMTDPVRDEWNKHQTKFAWKWRGSMMRKGKEHVVPVATIASLKVRIDEVVAKNDIADIIHKDRHLLEAALATEKRVISLDEKVRKHLKSQCVALEEIRSICWVNPTKPDEKAIEWLKSGARIKSEQTLGGTSGGRKK
jgi:hypothetical protein